jgi:hypothetical protein
MAKKGNEANPMRSPDIFDCDSEPIPPGTKSHVRLLRGMEQEKPNIGIWLLAIAAVAAALLTGVAIGRFILP